MSSHTDRNLLFAFIALQNGLLSREDLVAATSVWLQDKSQQLDQILLDRGFLSEDNHQMLLPLFQHHLAQHNGDPEKSLAAIDAVSSVREELQQLGDDDLEVSLVQATQIRESGGGVTRTIGWDPSSPDARYQILRPHGKGGLGLVSVAIDGELKREVAFKEIQEQYADNENGRARFLREAEITGRLEHPGIVPVYGLGQHENGRPYYAMRLVKGETLRAAINRFHQAKEERALDSNRSLVLRQLLRRFIDVCNAIEYAHSRGILHRDIKPSNVMLGKYGETLVVDWGLAKVVGRSEEYRDRGEETLLPASGEETSNTQLGSAIGTPSFMSPEQAAGRLDDLGTTSDVYSLGATLYCILTGRPPLHESDEVTTIRRAQEGNFPRPRDIKSGIPATLEAVCLKAMALVPENRYSSAAAIAEEIERWFADEPVTAYAESFSERAARFARRHRSWVHAVVVATLLIAACSVAATIFTNAARQREAAARQSAQRLAHEKTELAEQNAELVAAERERSRELERQLRISAVTRLAAQSQAIREDLPVHSVLLAIEAVELTRRYDGRVHPVAHETLLGTTHNLGGLPLIGHENLVLSTVIGPDGRWLVTTSADFTARLWDLTAANPATSSLVLPGHQDWVVSAAISPDGRWIATGSFDASARLWDLTTQNPHASSIELRGHDLEVTVVSISANNCWLVTGSRDATARLWDLTDVHASMPSLELSGHTGSVTEVAFSANSRWLVTAGEDNTPRLWDLDAPDIAKSSLELSGHEDIVLAIAISPDGRWLVTGSRDRTARVWDLSSDAPSASSIVLTGHESDLHSVAIAPNSRWLVTGSNTVRLWDLAADDLAEPARVMGGRHGFVSSLAFSPDSRRIVVGSSDGTARVWDIAAERAAESSLVLRGHQWRITSVAIGPKQRWLATGSLDGTARLWDFASENPASSLVLRSHKGGIRSVATNANGRWLITESGDKTARLWNYTHTRQSPVALSRVFGGPGDAISAVAVSQDGRLLATGTRNGDTRIQNLDEPTELARVLPGAGGRIWSLAIHPENRWFITGDDGKTAHLWDLNDPAALPQQVPGYQADKPHRWSSIAFSPDGQWLATARSGLGRRPQQVAAHLWKLKEKDPTSSPIVLRGPNKGIAALVFSLDSRWLVTSGSWADDPVLVWDLTAEDPIESTIELRGHQRTVEAIAISPNGRWLVTAGWDSIAIRWDLAAEDPASSATMLTGHTAALKSVAISPDSRWVVTGSEDSTARVCDLTAKDPASTSLVLRGHQTTVRSVSFSPDSRWVITGSDDTTVRFWDLNIDSLIQRARQLAGRDLTPKERKQYMVVAHEETEPNREANQ